MPRSHFPNFNKIKIISILKMKNKISDFLCIFVHFLDNQTQKYKYRITKSTQRLSSLETP